MAYWWVNQGKTWRDEVLGGFMWAPKTRTDGRRSTFYDNMILVKRGDVVFSYFAGGIGAVGLVLDEAVSSPKPDFGSAGERWNDDGWEVVVQFERLSSQIDPRRLLDLYRQTHSDAGPMNYRGQVKMNYLFSIDPAFATALGQMCGVDLEHIRNYESTDFQAYALLEDTKDVLGDDARTRTERRQLSLSRVGQGIFKSRVASLEPRCRITGVNHTRHLIASHIKPWRSSTDSERLDGANGLLLSPHIDHLFDRGLISFRDTGELIRSSRLPEEITQRWHVEGQAVTKPFTRRQRDFLGFHRDEVLIS